MLYTSFSLNGTWAMDYRPGVFSETEGPWGNGFPIENAVPGYWEDMVPAFRAAPFFAKLTVNPEYGLQRYPMAGSPPDTALPTIPGTFLYRREFGLALSEGSWELHFGGVQNQVWVWLNSTFLGSHKGYSTPFSMPVPDGLLRETNTLTMVVSNLGLTGFDGQEVSGLTNRAVNQYTGGITGDVELRCYRTPLRDLSVEISEDCSRATVRVEATEPAAFRWQVLDGDKVQLDGEAQEDFSFSTQGLSFWSPESPKRYTLRLIQGEQILQRSFGIRRLTVDGLGLRLNGLPYYLRGVCEHCYYPLTIHPSDDRLYYRNIIRKFKELGFNFIRFHTHVPAESYMQAADELGMLIQVESPNYASEEEYAQIIRFCRRHTSVVIYCCGNELEMDEPFIDYLSRCAQMVHTGTDALFSPMSALRGVEYFWQADKKDEHIVDKPFRRHPLRQERLGTFSDLYNSYTLARTSYSSLTADEKLLDSWSVLYGKPRLSHEICIQGTYIDLSLAKRYEDTPMSRTAMFSSIEESLSQKGLLEKAPLFYINSCQWQQRLRKHCFESTRLCKTIAGYDFLGPIDTHWHTFGYDVGMMNEFYEMKPGESIRDVRMYNSPTVLLTSLGTNRNFPAGSDLEVALLVSHFGEADLRDARLTLRLTLDGKLVKEELLTVNAENGTLTQLHSFRCKLPSVSHPGAMLLTALLECGDVRAENEWELYLFPENACAPGELVIDPPNADALWNALETGRDVLVLDPKIFRTLPTSFQIALAGRTEGNLATVIADHPAVEGFPHDGFCGWQFRQLLEGGKAIRFADGVPFDPIIEVASTPKNPIRQSILSEFTAGNGRLLVCGFCFQEQDPAAQWLKGQLIAYAQGDTFAPEIELTKAQLFALLGSDAPRQSADTNRAVNLNDKAAIRKRHNK